jgi:hypothetical protein
MREGPPEARKIANASRPLNEHVGKFYIVFSQAGSAAKSYGGEKELAGRQ